MDFDLEFSSEKSGEHKDHSPLKKSTISDSDSIGSAISSNPMDDGFLFDTNIGGAKVSTSSDDFEHIVKDNYDFLSKNNVPADIITTTVATASNLIDDFDNKPLPKIGGDKKLDDFDDFLSGSKDKQSTKNATMDFMAAERNESPKKSAKPSIYDEIENDYLNPYASKNNEKFISSEDLLGDFKDVDSTNIQPESSNFDDFTEDLMSAQSAPKAIETEVVIKSDPIVEPQRPIVPPPAIPTTAIKPAAAAAAAEVIQQKVEEVKPAVPSKPKEQMISAEEMFYRIGLDAWFKPDRLHPKVESLIYWRDPKKSGIVFGAGIAILLAISFFSVISVFAYMSLLGLIGTIVFRIYKNILQAVQKTSEGHPFKEYLEYELALPQEKVQQIANVGVVHVNAFLAELRRLFLVEDLVDSIKFGLLLWCLTYLGAWFNGMTLVILGFVSLFTLPKVYENNKQSIDTYLDLVRSKILEITEKVKTAVPAIGGKKAESEKDK